MIGTNSSESKLFAQVFMVGGDPVLRRAHCELIAHEKDLAVCGEAEDLHDAMKTPEGVTPDVVVLDLTHKDANRADLIHRIRQHWPSAKVIIICPNTQALPCVDMIETGVMGVVSKHEPTEQIVQAIRSALRGCVYCAQSEGQAASHWFG